MNAIILAAGLGSRFGEITQKTHKSLLPVGNKPNIERTIGYLIEFGIEQIIIVVGHLSESFTYLEEIYPQVKLVYNEHYSDYNNIYTFYTASEYFSDSFVIDADVVMLDNVLAKNDTSVYYTLLRNESEDKEWIPVIGENGYVSQMEISCARKPSMLGISFWKKSDCDVIKNALPKYMTKEILENPKLYWENIQIDNFGKLKLLTYEVNANLVGEMDNVDNYNEIKQKLEKLESK